MLEQRHSVPPACTPLFFWTRSPFHTTSKLLSASHHNNHHATKFVWHYIIDFLSDVIHIYINQYCYFDFVTWTYDDHVLRICKWEMQSHNSLSFDQRFAQYLTLFCNHHFYKQHRKIENCFLYCIVFFYLVSIKKNSTSWLTQSDKHLMLTKNEKII